jgi:FdhD protein
MMNEMNERVLLIAYGNRDREDDGAGWHVLNMLADALGIETPQLPGNSVQTPDGRLQLLYLFQLLPEMAEDLLEYNEIIFIDAHNSDTLPELSFEAISASTRHSAFTHHMSAEELLEICRVISGQLPKARMLSVRGHSFMFRDALSEQTQANVQQAFQLLAEYLGISSPSPAVTRINFQSYNKDSGLIADSRILIKEHACRLVLNGKEWLSFLCSPTHLEELALGYLWNEGLISNSNQVKEISISKDLQEIRVALDHQPQAPQKFQRSSTGIQADPEIQAESSKSKHTIIPLAASKLIQLYQSFSEQQSLHKTAGGFHAAGLADSQSVHFSVEDLGRHNCLDKLTGLYLRSGSSLQPLIILLSGRVSSEMIRKAQALGASFIVSRTTPTDRAIISAESAGITLIGYLRSNSFEVFTHPERICADA